MGAYIAMASKVLEELNLAQGALRQDLLAEDIGDLFDSNSLVGLTVNGGADGVLVARGSKGGGEGSPTKRCRTLLGQAPW